MLFVKGLHIFKLGNSNITNIGSKNIARLDISFCPKYLSNEGSLANWKVSLIYHYIRNN